MSYSMRIKVEGGQPSIEDVSGAVPDGTIMINGHEDATYVSLGVSRHEGDHGKVIAQASAYAPRS